MAKNLKNGLKYIGATTINLQARIADHIQKANKGQGSYFQEAIGTYGPDAFSWKQIDTANNANELAKKEKEYIIKYDSINRGYNSDSGGGFKKMVYQFDLKGNMISQYDSLNSASSATGLTKKRLSYACLSNSHLLNGSYWSYEVDFTIEKSTDNRKKQVYQYILNGEFEAKYDSVAEASRQTGLSKTCISRCCRGEREQTGGFLWKYI